MPWDNQASQYGPPSAAAAPPPAQPAAKPDPNEALMAYLSGKGPKPAQYNLPAGQPAAQTFDLSQFPKTAAPPPAAPPATAQPPAGGQVPGATGIATVPGTMPAPLSPPMPQMYSQADAPANVQMQQMPGGGLVDQSQAGAAKHALGLDRLPGFDQYLQQHQSQLPGQVWTGDAAHDARFGGYSQGDKQQMILKQYLGLQAGQSQGDQDATGRMNAANLGAYQQGQLGLGQQENALKSYQASLPYIGALSAIQGINSGAIDGFQAKKNQGLLGELAGGVGAPPGTPGQPPVPGAVPTTAGAPPPAGAPPKPGGADPFAAGNVNPAAMEYAFDAAAKDDAPKGPDGKPMPRSQADTVIQFENQHPGVLKSNPQALNALAAYLSKSGQGGDAGLQKLWRTTQTQFPGMWTQQTSEQRAQKILQDATEHHTGMTVPQDHSWMFGALPLLGSHPSQPIMRPAPAAPANTSPSVFEIAGGGYPY